MCGQVDKQKQTKFSSVNLAFTADLWALSAKELLTLNDAILSWSPFTATQSIKNAYFNF